MSTPTPTPTTKNKTPSPTPRSDTAAARVTLSTLTKPGHPLSYESDSEDSLHLGATDRTIRNDANSEDDLNYVPGGRRTDPTMVAARSKRLARDPSGGGDGGPPPPPPPAEQNNDQRYDKLNWWWKLLLFAALVITFSTLLPKYYKRENEKHGSAISSKSELLHYIDSNMKNVPQNFPEYNNMAVYNVRPVITTPTISKQQQLIGKALPKLSTKLSTDPLQLISQSSASSKIIITSTSDWQPPLPAGILRLRMRRSLPGVPRTLSRFLSADEIAEIQHYINVNNLSANDILRMFRGVEYTLFQVMDLLVAGNRNRVDVLMEPYYQEMYFNAGLTGKQALRAYTFPWVQQSYSLQQSSHHLISTQLAGYHGTDGNVMDDDAFSSEEDRSDPESQESDNEEEESDVNESNSNTGEDGTGDEEEDDGSDSQDDSDDDESYSDSEDEEDIDPEKDFDLHEPDDLAAAAEEETVLETLDTGSSEEVEAFIAQEQEQPESNHPNNFYDIPRSSPDECRRLVKERIHDINDAPQDLEEKKYDPICHRLLRGQKDCFSWLPKVPTRKSYKYKTTGEKKKAFPTPISCNLNIRDKSDTGPERQLLFVFLRYMPDNLRNAFEAILGGKVYANNNGKNRHPAEAMHSSEDRMIASSVEILRSMFGTEHWMRNVVMIETNPVSFPYGKSLSSVYGPNWIGEVRRRYAKVVRMAVEEAKNSGGRVKILLASSGVRDEFIDMIGGKDTFNQLRKENPDLFVDTASGPDKEFKTMTHPETFTNKKIINKIAGSFQSRCKTLSEVATQGLRHITQKKSIESNIGDQILNDIKDSPGFKAVLAATKALYERKREKYRKGEHPLQLFWQQMCKEKGYLIAGKVPSSKEAKRVYEEHEAFNRHWPKIQSYARDGNNYETLEDGKEVFVVPRRSDAYDYLSNLRRADNDDWRLKKLRDAGIDMDRYKEAREKKKQDFVEEKYEKSKKARSDNKFAVDEDSDSDEDL